MKPPSDRKDLPYIAGQSLAAVPIPYRHGFREMRAYSGVHQLRLVRWAFLPGNLLGREPGLWVRAAYRRPAGVLRCCLHGCLDGDGDAPTGYGGFASFDVLPTEGHRGDARCRSYWICYPVAEGACSREGKLCRIEKLTG